MIAVKLQTEILRAIRGKHTTSAMSAKLGYRFNQYARWEKGERRLLWTDFAAICQVKRLPLREQLSNYLGFKGDFSDTAEFSKTLLNGQNIGVMAKGSGLSRFKISRWLLGKGEPTFLDVMALLKQGVNILSFFEPLVDLENVPSFADEYRSLKQRRELAFTFPYLDALNEALIVRQYLEAPEHDSKILARVAGLPEQVVNRALALMLETGFVEKVDGKYRGLDIGVDYRVDKARMSLMLGHWFKETMDVAVRTRDSVEGSLIGFSLFSLSTEAHQEIQTLVRECVRSIHKIGSEDKGTKEKVFVFTTSLIDAMRFGS